MPFLLERASFSLSHHKPRRTMSVDNACFKYVFGEHPQTSTVTLTFWSLV